MFFVGYFNDHVYMAVFMLSPILNSYLCDKVLSAAFSRMLHWTCVTHEIFLTSAMENIKLKR